MTLFLNVVVPAHTRGRITLPGTGKPTADAGATASPTCAVASSGDDCCHATRPPTPAPEEKGGKQPTQQDRRNCAVCFVAAHFTPPPVVDLSPPPLGLAGRLPPAPVAARPYVASVPTYFACGPPAA